MVGAVVVTETEVTAAAVMVAGYECNDDVGHDGGEGGGGGGGGDASDEDGSSVEGSDSGGGGGDGGGSMSGRAAERW